MEDYLVSFLGSGNLRKGSLRDFWEGKTRYDG